MNLTKLNRSLVIKMSNRAYLYKRIIRRAGVVVLASCNLYIMLLLGTSSMFAQGTTNYKKIGDFIESTSYNDSLRGIQRRLQYKPSDDAFVCTNGNNRYTRALYGGHSAYRLETSDRPIFVSFVSGKNCKNISFVFKSKKTSLSLDTANCTSWYEAGKRIYEITASCLGNKAVRLTALALYDCDGAIWQFDFGEQKSLPQQLVVCVSDIRNPKLHRNGDMGVEKPGSLEATEDPQKQKLQTLDIKSRCVYVAIKNQELYFPTLQEGEQMFQKAESERQGIASRLRFRTPDAYFNTLGGTLAIAADAIWDGQVWLHGAVGWRMPLSGWRAAYTGDVTGWHDRARAHFSAYARSQVTDVECTIAHPAQDSAKRLARAEKKWGTPMYSNGYICRNPNRNDQMHHYDMNLCYIDELLWHLNWTGDLDYARQMWRVITSHLAWEKRNFDPDDDGLYDAYCCVWASDGMYYNSGGVTYSSAYNYRANKMAAMIAEKLGENATPYHEEAAKILKAMDGRLWMASEGHWAEYQDFMGNKLLHPSPFIGTIYHAIDSETADPFQAYQATRYIDTGLPHIAVQGKGLDNDGYEVVSTSNWMPYVWSTNNVALAELSHAALAYFQAGRADAGYKLLKSSLLDAMYLGNSPGNFAQVSFYDAARGECYRDFGDPIGITSRTLIQGVYGILPDALNGKLTIRPGFPHEWNEASIESPDVSYGFLRKDNHDQYVIDQRFNHPLVTSLQLDAIASSIKSVKVNGASTTWSTVDCASGLPKIVIELPALQHLQVVIEWGGDSIERVSEKELPAKHGDTLLLKIPNGQTLIEVFDPQKILDAHTVKHGYFEARLANKAGHHTFFIKTQQGEMEWWQPVDVNIEKPLEAKTIDFVDVKTDRCQTVNMDKLLNASVADIFHNKYLSPRSPYTTLQLPVQGIGEWCHPDLNADIDDSGLRDLVSDDTFMTSIGVPFRVKKEGQNITYTSLWDNYPDSVTVDLQGCASHAYMLMAGSTNQMQSRFVNGVVKVYYTDGSSETLELVNPDNWCPIEQDYFVDGKAFNVSEPRPYRLHFKSGLVSRDLGRDLDIKGVYGRYIDGGAGVLLDIPLSREKTLKKLTLKTIANDVIIGLMGITLQR